MPEQYLPAARTDKLLVRGLADETLVYDMEGHRAHCLNQTAALVWELCDGKSTVSRIAEKMGERLFTRVPDDVVRLALEQLNGRGLLAPSEMRSAVAGHISRRNMMRRIGLAAAVAVPLVTSVISPTPAQAQSPCNETSCPPGTFCNGSVCEPIQEL